MTKVRVSLWIVGAILLCVASSLITFFSLMATGAIDTGYDKNQIVIKLEDAEKTYDGTPLKASEYQIIEGNDYDVDISIAYTNEIKEATTGESGATVILYNKDGYDVTNDYLVKIIPGKLTIKQRPITLKVKDAFKEYDGTPLNGSEFEITGDLVAGDQVVPTFSGSVTEIKTDESTLKAEIFDRTGNKVTDNYDITYLGGSITVKRATLVIRSINVSKVYNGEVHDDNQFVTEGYLPEGATVEVGFLPTSYIENVGNTPSLIDENDIHVKYNGNDITENYVFACQSVGNLIVTPYKISATHDSKTLTYNGEIQSYLDVSLRDMDGKSIFINDENKFELFGNSYSLSVTPKQEQIYISSLQNDLDIQIYNSTKTKKLTENFEIDLNVAFLTIERKSIVVYGVEKEFDYDGEEKSLASVSDYKAQSGLIDGCDTIEVKYFSTSTQTEVGMNVVPIENVTITHKVTNPDGTTTNVDVTNCYSIVKLDGKITVKKHVVHVKGQNLSFMYDGKTHKSTDNNTETITDSPTTSFTCDIIYTTEAIRPNKDGSALKNEFYVKRFLDNNGTDITDNLEFEYEFGSVTISKPDTIVTVKNASRPFDGNDISLSDCGYTATNLAASDTITFKNDSNTKLTVSQMQAGTLELKNVSLENRVVIKNEDGIDVSYCYNISLAVTKVDLKVEKKNITIQTSGVTKTYDAGYVPIYEDGLHIQYFVSPDTPLGDDLYLEYDTTVLQGNYFEEVLDSGPITFTNSAIIKWKKEGLNLDVTKLFNISYIQSNVTIQPQAVNVVLPSYTYYLGDTYSNMDFQSYIGSYYDYNGDAIALTNSHFTFNYTLDESDITGVGSYTNSMQIIQSDNFIINVIPGTVSVIEKPKMDLYITIDDQEITVGEAYNDSLYTISDASMSITVMSSYDTIQKPGTYTLLPDLSAIDLDEYNLILTTGILTVSKIIVTITIDDQNIEYMENYNDSLISVSDTALDITLGSTYTLGSNVGTYSLVPIYGSVELSNYEFIVTTGVLTVTKKTVFITIDNQTADSTDSSWTLDDSLFTASSLVTGLAVQTAYKALNPTGTYQITLDYSGIDSMDYKNYEFVVTNGLLFVS